MVMFTDSVAMTGSWTQYPSVSYEQIASLSSGLGC